MFASRNYVNSCLVHWTGRGKENGAAFSILENICQEQVLRLSHCPTYVQPDLQSRVAMVCFTDIPLEHSHEHCSKFGQFGLGFKKSSMIAYGANPVLYTTGLHLERIRHIDGLLARMKDLEKDREWRSEIEHYKFTEDETAALLEVLGLLQEYSYKNADGSDYLTYYQREWRLTFDVLPFASGMTAHTPGKSCFYVRDGQSHPIFKFETNDVEYIVVPGAYEKRARTPAGILGCNLKIYEDEVRA